MSVKEVRVLVRSGEVLLVLDSGEELRQVLSGGVGPRGEDAGAHRLGLVEVDRVLWRAVQGCVGTAECMVREIVQGRTIERREWFAFLQDVQQIRRQWAGVDPRE